MRLLSAVLPLLAAVPEWTVTFDPAATASYLDRPNPAVLVVGAGESTTSSVAATAAIARALRSSGRARLVMTGESIAVRSADTDAEVVKKAAVLPVELVLVVRTFPGAAETAVATFYDKSGASVAALAGTLGQPLPHQARQVAATAGRDGVSATVKQHVEARDERITFGAGAMVNIRTGQVMSAWVTPIYRGAALNGARFYEVVGHPELAAQYRGRVGIKVILALVGAGALVAGPLIGLVTSWDSSKCAIYDASSGGCLRTRGTSFLVPGLIIGGAGLVSLLVGLILPANPVNAERRFELVEAHNKAVEEGAPAQNSARDVAPEVRVGLGPIPGGFAGSLAFTF
jgi:hypothetical protein